MEICFEGIGQVVATFRTEDEALEAGMAVTMTDSGEVGLGVKEGDSPLCGVTVSAARDGAVAVQIGGVVKVGCSKGAVPDVGYATLVCDETGGVKTTEDADGAKCLVLAVDEDKKSVAVKL